MEILSSVGLFTTSQVSFLRFSSYLTKTMLLKMNATTDFVKHFRTLCSPIYSRCFFSKEIYCLQTISNNKSQFATTAGMF